MRVPSRLRASYVHVRGLRLYREWGCLYICVTCFNPTARPAKSAQVRPQPGSRPTPARHSPGARPMAVWSSSPLALNWLVVQSTTRCKSECRLSGAEEPRILPRKIPTKRNPVKKCTLKIQNIDLLESILLYEVVGHNFFAAANRACQTNNHNN